MKKIATLLFFLFSVGSGFSQIVVDTALVPQYCQGVNGTNNSRVVCWFWAELSGMTPGATYRYYTTMDTLNASPTSNGAGVPILVNATSGTIRRTSNPSLSTSTNHDSITADVNGTYKGWFGVDASGNARYTPGNTIYPKFIFNNGAGGTSVSQRVVAGNYPITVINFGTTNTATEGSALYDSLDATPKNFICVYDNTAAAGRPLAIAIVENDGLDLVSVTSTAAFYRNNVDTLAMHWGAIIPNTLANGVRALEERDFTNGTGIDTVMDADGWWCSGVNTANMTSGSSGVYLNSTFSLMSSAVIPDTAWVGLPANFNATTNDPGATIMWDYGDLSTDSGAMTSHTYIAPGVFSVTVIISNGGCSDTIWHNVVVLLGTNIPRHIQLGFDVMPNPSNGEFNITSKSGAEKEIEVYNVLGDVVFTSTFTGNTTSINLTNLEKGVYFMRVRENVAGGKTATKRIIIQ
jgi:hypothetical protein